MTLRSLTRTVALGAIAALAATGCSSKKEEPAAQKAPAAAASPAPEAKAPEKLKIGFIYVGPVGDAGYSYQHDLGRRKAAEKFADRVETTFVENVKEGPDAERIARDLVAQGAKVVFATSFGHGESLVKVAKDHPEVRFEHATGFKTAENLRVYEPRIHEGAYLAGIVAGYMTKTNTLGFVASFPIPEVLRNINAFTLGAQSVNPKIKTKVVWLNTWYDPPKETEAAQSLMNGGADVLLQNTDSTAVLQAAERAGKYAFGWDSDMSAFAPKAHLGSAVLNWDVYYEKAFRDVLEGTWTVQETKWGVEKGMVDFVKPAEFLPAEAKAAVDTARAELASGKRAVFAGPIVDSTGKERLPKGVVADDQWLGAVDFYVQGVEGKLPTSN